MGYVLESRFISPAVFTGLLSIWLILHLLPSVSSTLTSTNSIISQASAQLQPTQPRDVSQSTHHRDTTLFPHHGAKHHGEGRHIYIDLGTNDGSSIISFTKQISSTGLAGDGSGTLAGGWKDLVSRPDGVQVPLSKWHILAFEAYHGHNEVLAGIQKNLTDTKTVASIKIYNATAISTHDGNIKFIYDAYEVAGTAATTMKESAAANGKVVTVPCMDIVTLFRREHITIDDFVVLKIDVEGSEYDLVRRMIVTGLYRFVDKLAVEW